MDLGFARLVTRRSETRGSCVDPCLVRTSREHESGILLKEVLHSFSEVAFRPKDQAYNGLSVPKTTDNDYLGSLGSSAVRYLPNVKHLAKQLPHVYGKSMQQRQYSRHAFQHLESLPRPACSDFESVLI